jgi:hypothetical protein
VVGVSEGRARRKEEGPGEEGCCDEEGVEVGRPMA